jgi:hypothetical protein
MRTATLSRTAKNKETDNGTLPAAHVSRVHQPRAGRSFHRVLGVRKTDYGSCSLFIGTQAPHREECATRLPRSGSQGAAGGGDEFNANAPTKRQSIRFETPSTTTVDSFTTESIANRT